MADVTPDLNEDAARTSANGPTGDTRFDVEVSSSPWFGVDVAHRGEAGGPWRVTLFDKRGQQVRFQRVELVDEPTREGAIRRVLSDYGRDGDGSPQTYARST